MKKKPKAKKMTIEQRKRLEHLKAKQNERLATKADASPLSLRVSVYGAQHLGSKAGDWCKAEGLGWYHVSEKACFDKDYAISYLSKKCFKRIDCVRVTGYVGNDRVTNYVARSELKEHGWGMCSYSGRAAPLAMLGDARNNDGEPISVIRKYLEPEAGEFGRCGVTGWMFGLNNMIRFNPVTTYELVSHYAIAHKQWRHLFAACRLCGATREFADLLDRSGTGRPECTPCYNSRRRNGLINAHNHNKYPKPLTKPHEFYRMVKGKPVKVPDDYFRLYGVECEVEISDAAHTDKLDRYKIAEQMYTCLGNDFIILKNDGSLTMHNRDHDLHGIEMVTGPCDLETHRERWKRFESMPSFKYLRAWDTITCGMHVHVSRNVLTTLQIGRLLVFIGHKKNKKFVAHVAGRSGGQDGYNRIVDKKYGDAHRPDPDKYTAINTLHSATVEFRIFRGTVRYRHIIRNIEFVDALCTFCHPASRALNDISNYEKFVEFVGTNRKQWPLLTEWLVAQKYIKPLRLKPGTKPDEVVEAELVEKGEQKRR